MSSQPPTTPRIEDLRARLRLDPKARHFYPLAEELRRMGQLDEAETILREGLEHHGTYLSAWMSLGRILAEKGDHREAVEALLKALALDQGNVVCARLLATSYLALGEKVEALKKLKLVRAVMPGDAEVDEQIGKLEGEIGEEPGRAAGFAAPAAPEMAAEPSVAAAAVDEEPLAETAPEVLEPAAQPEGEPSWPAEAPPDAAHGAVEEEPPASCAAEPAASPFLTEPDEEGEIAALPSDAAEVLPEEAFAPSFEADHPLEASIPETSPGQEESLTGASEQEQIDEAMPESVPLVAGEPAEPAEEPREPFPAEEAAVTSAPAEESWPSESDERPVEPAGIADERTATLTMAELYAKQGHAEAAREIYERVLERDPLNEDVRSRLAALSAPPSHREQNPRHEAAARLERWLEKVGRREL